MCSNVYNLKAKKFQCRVKSTTIHNWKQLWTNEIMVVFFCRYLKKRTSFWTLVSNLTKTIFRRSTGAIKKHYSRQIANRSRWTSIPRDLLAVIPKSNKKPDSSIRTDSGCPTETYFRYAIASYRVVDGKTISTCDASYTTMCHVPPTIVRFHGTPTAEQPLDGVYWPNTHTYTYTHNITQ